MESQFLFSFSFVGILHEFLVSLRAGFQLKRKIKTDFPHFLFIFTWSGLDSLYFMLWPDQCKKKKGNDKELRFSFGFTGLCEKTMSDP